MSKKTTFSAKKRELVGKAVKQLRREGFIPANISGAIAQPVSIVIERTGFAHLFEEVGETGLIYLSVEDDGQDLPVLVDDVQFDPLSGETVHVVFKKVNLKEKITAEVPVEVIGENKVPGGVVLVTHNSVEVEALPTDLPEKFEIDLGKFTEIGQSVTFADLSYDKSKVTLMIDEEQLEEPVVVLQAQAVQEEPEETPAETVTEAAPVTEEKATESEAK